MKTPLLTLTLASTAFFASNLSARPEARPERPDPETIAVEMFTEYDANENDTLSQDELVAALTGIREKHKGNRPGGRPGMKRERPDGDDTDRPMKPGKGKRKGPPSPEKVAPKLIEDFDASGDGELNTEELLEALKGMHERGSRGGKNKRAATSE